MQLKSVSESSWLKSYQPQLKVKERLSMVVAVWFVNCFQKYSGKAMRWGWKSWQPLMISFNFIIDTHRWPFVLRIYFHAFTRHPDANLPFKLLCTATSTYSSINNNSQAHSDQPPVKLASNGLIRFLYPAPLLLCPRQKIPDYSLRPELKHASQDLWMENSAIANTGQPFHCTSLQWALIKVVKILTSTKSPVLIL